MMRGLGLDCKILRCMTATCTTHLAQGTSCKGEIAGGHIIRISMLTDLSISKSSHTLQSNDTSKLSVRHRTSTLKNSDELSVFLY